MYSCKSQNFIFIRRMYFTKEYMPWSDWPKKAIGGMFMNMTSYFYLRRYLRVCIYVLYITWKLSCTVPKIKKCVLTEAYVCIAELHFPQCNWPMNHIIYNKQACLCSTGKKCHKNIILKPQSAPKGQAYLSNSLKHGTFSLTMKSSLFLTFLYS